MCVAELNVALQPCAHRWYHLVKPCSPANNLANCPEKLRLEGWERRNDDCPFCDDETKQFPPSTHRLFGSTSSASSVASSPTMSDAAMTPPYSTRRGSLGTIAETMTPLSRQSSGCSLEFQRSVRAREMNDRIHIYLSSDPHQVLPSARKNYPTYSAAIARSGSFSSAQQSNFFSSKNGDSTRPQLLMRKDSFSRGWKRMSGRFTPDLFKIV